MVKYNEPSGCSIEGPPQIFIKEFDTIRLLSEYLNDDGTAKSLEGLGVFSQIRDLSGDLVADLSVDITDEAVGLFTLRSIENKIDAGKYALDILYVDAERGTRIASDTIELIVRPAITTPQI